MKDPDFVLGLFILFGVLYVVLGLPLKYEKVPPNWFYGFRTPKTLSSKEIWYPVNRVAGIDMIRTGVVLIAAALVIIAARNLIAPETSIFILLAIGVAMTAWMVIHGFSVLPRM